jgi:hypothetical protein
MALTAQVATRQQVPPSPPTMFHPDYEAEADRGRLKLRGNQERPSSSRAFPKRTLAEEILGKFRGSKWKR